MDDKRKMKVIKIENADLARIRALLFSELFEGKAPEPQTDPDEYWVVYFCSDDEVFFRHYIAQQSLPIESYRTAKGNAAVLDLAAISLGFQPLHHLHHLDRPVD